jgi:signal transduction histidine kinase
MQNPAMGLPPRFHSLPRYALYVALFNVAIAVVLSVAQAGGRGFVDNLVYSEFIGMTGWLLIDVPRRLMWSEGRPPLAPFLALSALAIVLASLGGTWLASSVLGHPWPWTAGRGTMTGLITLVAMTFALTYFWQSGKAAHMEAEAAQERTRAETVERQVVEAKLRLLQAQIEPHFLFNTLANLHALISADPPRAKKMLEHLNDYLRASLDMARRDSETLGEEFALLRGYLEVLQIRMDSRLAFGLTLPDELSGLKVPPMLLQPLVENAVKHGLEPKAEGGRIEVSAFAKDGFAHIQVADSGLGMGASPVKGAGVGLDHVRQRLAARDPRASLEIADNANGGVTATVRLPLG